MKIQLQSACSSNQPAAECLIRKPTNYSVNGLQLWIFRESITQLVGYRNKHFTVGGFSEQALSSWWIFGKITSLLVAFY